MTVNPTPQHPSPTRAELVRWRNGVFLLFFISGVGLAGWMARVPAVKDALDTTTAQMGVLLVYLAVGSIVGLVASGHLIAAVATRRLMAVSFFVGPAGLIAAGAGVAVGPGGFVLVGVGLTVYGVGLAMVDVSMNLSGAVNERMLGRTLMPIYHACFSAGTIVGAGMGALTELLDVSVLAQCIVVAAALLVLGLLGVRMSLPETVGDDPAQDAAPSALRHRLAVWRDPRVLLLGVLVLGMALAEGAANDWLSLAMVEGHHFERASAATVFGVFVTAMTVGRLAGAPLIDRWGRVLVLRATIALAIVGLSVVIFARIDWVVIVGVALWGLGASLGFPTGMSAAADNPRTAAATVSAVATIGYIAFLAGPLTIGFLGEQVGILHALILVLGCMVAAALATGAARPVVR